MTNQILHSAAARERVLGWIDTHTEEIIQFLQDLIRVPSVNPWFVDEPGPGHEKEVQEVIAQRLKPLGATIDQWEPDVEALTEYRGRSGYTPDHVYKGRPDQAALLKGSGGGRSILLTGHVDVVKAGSRWTTDPFGGERRDGMIYGRGAVDMKGGIASMIMAAEAVVRSGVKLAGDVLVGTVVDEETGGAGTLALVARGYRADACIVTEATNLKVAPLCRGILWGKLTIKGRSGHIELPHPHWTEGGAVDAIQKAHLYLDAFERLNQDWALRKRHPLLARPCQVFIGQIRAGEYPSTFANQAELMFNAQFLPRERDELGLGGNVKKEIEDFVSAVAATDSWLSQNPPEIQWLVNADCAETPGDHEFVRLCAHAMEGLGTPPEVEGLGFHTDMGWFVDVGIPTINFGAGNVTVAHQNDEAIGEADLVQATRIMAAILLDWCGVAE